jgi:hypothetical protein
VCSAALASSFTFQAVVGARLLLLDFHRGAVSAFHRFFWCLAQAVEEYLLVLLVERTVFNS